MTCIAGSAAWLAASPVEQRRRGAGLLAVLREVAVEVMACDSYLTEVGSPAACRLLASLTAVPMDPGKAG